MEINVNGVGVYLGLGLAIVLLRSKVSFSVGKLSFKEVYYGGDFGSSSEFNGLFCCIYW